MSGSAVFIGRVGALAVALGVGAAIAGGGGVAGAETTDSAGPTATESSAERGSEPDGTQSDAEDADTTDTETVDTETADAEAEDPDTTDDADADDVHEASEPEAAAADVAQRRGTSRTLTVRSSDPGVEPERGTVGASSADDSAPTPPDPATLAALGAARRDIGHDTTERTALTSVAPSATTSGSMAQPSVLGTPQQLAAEKLAERITNSLPVRLVKLVLKSGFLAAAHRQFERVGGPDQQNLDRLDAAIDAYAMAAAFQQQLLNSAKPTVVMQVAPPHTWYGQDVGASRILYDNPDTIYRFMGVNGASSYVITGRFADPANLPADTSFSVLTGLTGNTAAVLTKDKLVIGPDGSFTITADRTAADGRDNHLQLTADTTLIATRNTLSDWAGQHPMSLEIARVGGPPNSLFNQLGGFAIPGIGPAVVRSPVLTRLVSLVPPLPHVPDALRGAVAAIIMALGVQREEKYMAVATTDPTTGARIDPNVLKDPTRNAEFLATQLQSAGYFQLADDEALVITIDRGSAGYFVVPVTDDWTVTHDFWNEQTSLNSAQAEAEPDGTYTLVVSPIDPGVANWVSTGGLNQGTISIRFQDLQSRPGATPAVRAQVVPLSGLPGALPATTRYLTVAQRTAQITARKAAFDRRFAPYPQP